MSVELVFETHSLSTDNERGFATGWLDGQLSEAGRRLARELGERREDDGLAAVFTSDLGRAVETSDIAFAGRGIPVRRDWRLRECDYGVLNGAPIARFAAERPRSVEEPFPGGESYRDVVRRVESFLGDVAAAFDGARVLAIGHAATRWALDHLLDGQPLEELVAASFDWREGWLYAVPGSVGTTPR